MEVKQDVPVPGSAVPVPVPKPVPVPVPNHRSLNPQESPFWGTRLAIRRRLRGKLGSRWCCAPQLPNASASQLSSTVQFQFPSAPGDILPVPGPVPESTGASSVPVPELVPVPEVVPDSEMVWSQVRVGTVFSACTLLLFLVSMFLPCTWFSLLVY